MSGGRARRGSRRDGRAVGTAARRAAPGAASAAAVVLLLSGCVTDADAGVDADCGDAERLDNPVLALMAQAVPTATLIPSVRLVPASWRHGDVDVHSGRASFSFASGSVDSPDAVPVEVVLTEGCDTAGATEVPTDEPGTRRWERLRQVAPAYAGDRLYVFDGGCVRLRFRLTGSDRVQAVGEASLAIGFLPRAAVREAVRRRSDGQLELDGPGAPT